MKKLLLTAFEPFAGESINPSLEAARQMEKIDFRETVIHVAELPVDRHRAVAIAVELIRSIQPDIVMMLGEAGGRYRRLAIEVSLESLAENKSNAKT